uniref:Uncharacterized protein n=1 Tax=Pseudomonas marincola TaxID=437900 RepID=A0A653EAV7_9PSED
MDSRSGGRFYAGNKYSWARMRPWSLCGTCVAKGELRVLHGYTRGLHFWLLSHGCANWGFIARADYRNGP